MFKGSVNCLLSQQPGEDHEPLLLAMVSGWGQKDVIGHSVKKGLEMKLDIDLHAGEKENRVYVSRSSSKRKEDTRMSVLWPTKSLEVLHSMLVSMIQ